MFDGFGPAQLGLVLLILLVLFGGSRIPEVMRGLGSGIRQFKKGLQEEEQEPPGGAAGESAPPDKNA